MLDIKRIRDNYEEVKAAVERRGKGDFGIERVRDLDIRRREILAEVEALKNKQNVTSREVPKLKKAGEDTTALFAEMKQLSARIKELDGEVAGVAEELQPVPRLVGLLERDGELGDEVGRTLCAGRLVEIGANARSALEKLAREDELLPFAGKDLDEPDDFDGERLALRPERTFARFRSRFSFFLHFVHPLLTSFPASYRANQNFTL